MSPQTHAGEWPFIDDRDSGHPIVLLCVRCSADLGSGPGFPVSGPHPETSRLPEVIAEFQVLRGPGDSCSLSWDFPLPAQPGCRLPWALLVLGNGTGHMQIHPEAPLSFHTLSALAKLPCSADPGDLVMGLWGARKQNPLML